MKFRSSKAFTAKRSDNSRGDQTNPDLAKPYASEGAFGCEDGLWANIRGFCKVPCNLEIHSDHNTIIDFWDTLSSNFQMILFNTQTHPLLAEASGVKMALAR
jgi:hypothetical protein